MRTTVQESTAIGHDELLRLLVVVI